MAISLAERGAKMLMEWADGKVVIDHESVYFYGEDTGAGDDGLVFSLSHDNFDDVIAVYEQYHNTGD